MAPARMIPVEKCVIPEVRITAVYDDELQKMLHDSLGVMGQVVPIIVVEHEGLYYVADGKHRLEEARARGDTQISAVLRKGTPADVLLLNLVTNRTRGKVKASELVIVLGELYEKHGLDPDQISQKTGISRDTIEKYLVVSKAAPEVREALDAEVIGIGHAFEIARLPHQEQQAEIVAKYQVWKWPISALREQINAVLSLMEAPAAETATATPTRVVSKPRCDVCKQEHEPRELRPVFICPGCFGDAWNLAAERGKRAQATAKPA